MLLKAVCLTSASLAVHSNVIEELQEFHELQNLKIKLIMHYCATYVIK